MAKFSFNLSENKRQIVYNAVAMFLIFLSGLFMAISYWILGKVQSAFQQVNCLLPENIYFTTCQEWLALSIYPALELRNILVWFSYFYIFGIIIGMFYLGFKMKKHPSLFIVHIILSIIFGYMSIEIANIYRILLENPFLYEILSPFAIYNKIMLYFPQFMFFTIFISGLIGFLAIYKGKFNQGVDEIK